MKKHLSTFHLLYLPGLITQKIKISHERRLDLSLDSMIPVENHLTSSTTNRNHLPLSEICNDIRYGISQL